MKCLIILVAVVATVCCERVLDPQECGKRLSDFGKIVGGGEAQPGDWGWQITMLYRGSMMCGGSLINKRWIVTAAHCVYHDRSPYNYRIIVGAHNRVNPESWSRTYSVDAVILHEQYSSSTLKNDIALIRLSGSVDAYSKYIVPACLDQGNNALDNQDGWATGWGATHQSSSFLPSTLMEVKVKILSPSRCSQKYYGTDRNTQICAGDNHEYADSCQGDSGGPLVTYNSRRGLWELIGITSYGTGCGNGGVYTRVSAYRGWISSKLY